MRTLLLIACAALPLVACGGAADDTEGAASSSDALTWPARDQWVDFDQVLASPIFPTLGSTPVANGSVVDTAYTGYGVTLSCVVCTSGHAFARALSNANNGVSLVDPQTSVLPYFDARNGAVIATFNTGRSWVSIDAAPVLPPEFKGTPVSMPWIEAYDANGNFLAKTLYPIAYGQPGYGDAHTLTVSSGSASIKSVRFSSRYVSGTPPVYGTFDNLRFNGDPIVLTPIAREPGYPTRLLVP
jgi:hypothetical protein